MKMTKEDRECIKKHASFNAPIRMVCADVDALLAENEWLTAERDARAELAALKGRTCATCQARNHCEILKTCISPLVADDFGCRYWGAKQHA